MTAGKATLLLEHHLKQLKLPAVPREYGKLAQVCQAEQADYQAYLLRLVEQELLVRELLRGEYIDKRENVLLIGNSGTGKTHLATALAFQACSQALSVRFTTVTSLVTRLLEQR
jgi:DNA replication protein DnaC